MARRKVAVFLMQNGAAPDVSDVMTHQHQILRDALRKYLQYARNGNKRHMFNWEASIGTLRDAGGATQSVTYEPFFVPRAAAVRSLDSNIKNRLRQLGVVGEGRVARVIFCNVNPGVGLAFLVATGCVRDYPVELAQFFFKYAVSPEALGHFLGENYSLSQILRLEFLNLLLDHEPSMTLPEVILSTFTRVAVLPAFQALDRIIHALAHVWWRKERMHTAKNREEGSAMDGLTLGALQLTSIDGLCQLLFNCVMLAWAMQRATDSSCSEDDVHVPEVDVNAWMALNAGMDDGDAIPLATQQRLYHDIESIHHRLQTFFGNCQSTLPTSLDNHTQSYIDRCTLHSSTMLAPNNSPLPFMGDSVRSSLQVRMESFGANHTHSDRTRDTDTNERGTALPSSRSSSGRHVSAMTAVGAKPPAGRRVERGKSARGGGGLRELTFTLVQGGLLFMSTCERSVVPDAFVHLPMVEVVDWKESQRLFTLGGRHGANLQIVYLLEDARWQVVEVPRVCLKAQSDWSFNTWMQHLHTVQTND
ncbi:unnamed protein product [Vitrella brassicaformis CCMP3155]|uniref:SEC7 domain-containing protein n=1 Tax=Vitrella brassicaformis (strain CCMP3155) TaxID=1169540 RepID=A0A0G4GX57_VITBC|nr:unnamed protein product [Vitrella brassicaformis CCMP3155]|eukprot:CEM35647.1 unnamed protein product [Vitrella brassicaformis CCMP3155]